MKNIITMRSAFVAITLIVGLAASAESRFYVDSDSKGWHNGSAASPWQDLSPDKWSAITKGLESGPLTVYFNSRQKQMGRTVDLSRAKAGAFGKNRLTLDGQSFYRSGEGPSSWVAETDPARKAPLSGINSENMLHVKRSMVTVRGFRIVAINNKKAVTIAGDNWVLENCDCSTAPGATKGPCVLLVPTADHKHGGSGAYTLPCTNIIIRGNEIHDSYGEALYVGGGGSQAGEPGSGYPSHDQVLIESNIIHDAGTRGKQGDGIDVKGGISHVTIRGNDIYHLASFENRCDVRGIVMEGQAPGLNQSYILEGNRIHDCTGIEDGAIALVDSWGRPRTVSIRNNVIYNITGRTTRPPSGIKLYACTDEGWICNNTITHCAGYGLYLVGGAKIIVCDNLVFGNHGNQAEIGVHDVALESDYNAFSPPWGFAGEGSHSLSLPAEELANALMNPAAGDFRLKPGSPLVGKGEPSKMFGNDFSGQPRGGTWDIGAFNSTDR